MKECNLCQGRGVRQIHPGYDKGGIANTTRSLWPWALCPCVAYELGALRGALVGAGLFPLAHWQRGLPLPEKHERLQSQFILHSKRSDGYIVISRARLTQLGGLKIEAMDPNGSMLLDEDREPMWWASIADAERFIDQLHPLPPEEP